MDKLLNDVTSGYWWLSVVLVGLLINLASAYIKDPIDRKLAQLAAGWGHRSEKKQLQIEGDARSIALNPDILPYWIAHEMRVYTLAIFLTLIAVLAAVSVSLLPVTDGEQPIRVTGLLKAALLALTAVATVIALRLFARGIDITIAVRTSMRLRQCANWKPAQGCAMVRDCSCTKLRFRPKNLGG